MSKIKVAFSSDLVEPYFSQLKEMCDVKIVGKKALGRNPTEDELLKLEDAHYRKIDLSDGIYVVNMDGYVGTSVKKEIEYAERHGKEVLYHYNQ